jgi:hypothetical protein
LLNEQANGKEKKTHVQAGNKHSMLGQKERQEKNRSEIQELNSVYDQR